MAQAKINTSTVTEYVRQDIEVTEVVLTLTQKEAEVLKFVCCNVGGDHKKTNRKYTDNIKDALTGAGIRDISCSLDYRYTTIHLKE